ncbi:hypothetical protein TKK_0007516 [Trichogramma kaykai]|uniref:HTH CENPB-type domain-containing protein n=1 Tax=Trichogramma kaykai TaxID=54128 RepID=A0ABD2WGV0_9HYME
MQQALDEAATGKSLTGSAKKFGIPPATLRKKVNMHNQEGQSYKIKTGCKPTFNPEQEQAICKYIEMMEIKMMGLSAGNVRRLAFDFATKLKLPHKFSQKKGMAGPDWLKAFMKRNKFSLRKTEHTSLARVNGFNEESVKEFFTLLKAEMDKYNFTADRIYHCDETGVSVVPKSCSKVVARRGRKQVGGATAAERGETVTAEICVSAAGSYMPIMLIFPRVRENKALLKGAPPGAWAKFDKSGWMQAHIFTEWFKKFILLSRATKNNPVLLILDGHSSHTENLEILDLSNENGVVIICLPPHCSHRLQPLDVTFMKPFSHYYMEEVTKFQRKGDRVGMPDIFSLLGKAFMKAAKIETAVNGFEKTGIFPFNSEIFSDDDFASSSREDFMETSSQSTDDESRARINEHVHELNNLMIDDQDESTFLFKPAHCQTSPSNEKDNSTPVTDNMDEMEERVENEETEKDNSTPVTENMDEMKRRVENEETVVIPKAVFDCIGPLVQWFQNSCVGTKNIDNNGLSNLILRDIGNSQDRACEKRKLVEDNSKESIPIKKKKRTKGKAAVITSTEYKENLIAVKKSQINIDQRKKKQILIVQRKI